jgi:hypothetical protein
MTHILSQMETGKNSGQGESALADTTAATIGAHLEGAIECDALLVTNGAPFFPPLARALGLTHQPLDHKAVNRPGFPGGSFL